MKTTLYLILTGVMVCLEIFALKSCDDERIERQAQKEKQIAERGCVVAGFYGRSGEYKVYNCHGLIFKEVDL